MTQAFDIFKMNLVLPGLGNISSHVFILHQTEALIVYCNCVQGRLNGAPCRVEAVPIIAFYWVGVVTINFLESRFVEWTCSGVCLFKHRDIPVCCIYVARRYYLIHDLFRECSGQA